MASDSSHQSHKLTRILKRGGGFRPFDEEDLKFVWAAYKKGAMAEVGPGFPEGMSVKEFDQKFREYAGQFDDIISFVVEGNLVGFGVMLLRHGNWIIIGDLVWFPWVSSRDVLTATVWFVNEIRKTHVLYEYADAEKDAFWVHICKYGIMRRVGSVENSLIGKRLMLFQSVNKG